MQCSMMVGQACWRPVRCIIIVCEHHQRSRSRLACGQPHKSPAPLKPAPVGNRDGLAIRSNTTRRASRCCRSVAAGDRLSGAPLCCSLAAPSHVPIDARARSDLLLSAAAAAAAAAHTASLPARRRAAAAMPPKNKYYDDDDLEDEWSDDEEYYDDHYEAPAPAPKVRASCTGCTRR